MQSMKRCSLFVTGRKLFSGQFVERQFHEVMLVPLLLVHSVGGVAFTGGRCGGAEFSGNPGRREGYFLASLPFGFRATMWTLLQIQ